MVMGARYYYWVRATYMDMSHDPPRSQQTLSGYWLSESDAWTWGTRHYAALPGANFEVLKSRSRDRAVVRGEKRTGMLDDGEGDVPDVLRVRFRDQNKKGDQET